MGKECGTPGNLFFERRVTMSTLHTKRYRMNLMSVIVFVLCLLLVATNSAFAAPFLQLDADPAIYVGPPEDSVVTTSDVFTLYALINSNSGQKPSDWATTDYYLSFALVPERNTAGALGSFIFAGETINVTTDMIYDIPPITTIINKTLPSHDVFKTYFTERSFDLTGATQTDVYDVEVDGAGGPGSPSSGDLYYQSFAVDASLLSNDYYLHIDLYTGSGKSIYFAPPSHDLLHTPIPASVILGILGMGVVGLKLRKFA